MNHTILSSLYTQINIDEEPFTSVRDSFGYMPPQQPTPEPSSDDHTTLFFILSAIFGPLLLITTIAVFWYCCIGHWNKGRKTKKRDTSSQGSAVPLHPIIKVVAVIVI